MFSSLTLDQDIVGGKGDNDSSRLNNVYIEYVIDGITDIKWIVWVETTENHNEKWADDVDVGPGRIISIMASVEVILIMEPAVEIIMTAEVFFLLSNSCWFANDTRHLEQRWQVLWGEIM